MNKKLLIVASDYYKDITKNLIIGSLKKFKNTKKNITIIKVPGTFEIPVVISKNIKRFDGFIALGCVIKGQTPHFDFISRATTDHLMKISVDNKKPIGNGIITCLNKKQAIKRKNKGKEASKAVMSVLSQ